MSKMVWSIAALVAVAACSEDKGGDDPSYCDEIPTGRVELPADDAVHDSAMEWWYWTGHLRDDAGAQYGFQITFFLFGDGAARATLANVALTDVDGATFSRAAKFEFTTPTRLEAGFDFEVGPHQARGADGVDTLHSELEDAVLDLSATATRAPVFHHGDGYTDYSVGGFTYYYSRTHMEVEGELTIGGERRHVGGTAWFDHQWGDLAPIDEAGWDWFAVQLDDGRDIMVFLVHGADGPQLVGGTMTDAKCRTTELDPSTLELAATGEWTSAESGCTYPSGWTLDVDGLALTIAPYVDAQEFYNARDPSTTYWEGAAAVDGDSTGRAYVELVGYCR